MTGHPEWATEDLWEAVSRVESARYTFSPGSDVWRRSREIIDLLTDLAEFIEAQSGVRPQ